MLSTYLDEWNRNRNYILSLFVWQKVLLFYKKVYLNFFYFYVIPGLQFLCEIMAKVRGNEFYQICLFVQVFSSILL